MLFEWDDGNIFHIAYHNLLPQEVEEVFRDPRRIGVPSRKSHREKRYAMIGRTLHGRILFIVFTRRNGKIRVVTARDATTQEKRLYRR